MSEGICGEPILIHLMDVEAEVGKVRTTETEIGSGIRNFHGRNRRQMTEHRK